MSQYPNQSDPYSNQPNPYSNQPHSSYQYPQQGYPQQPNQPYPQQPNQQYGQQPYYPPPPPYYPPSPPPRKKNNLLLILGIIGGLVLLACVGLGIVAANAGRKAQSDTTVVSTTVPNGNQNPAQTPAPASNDNQGSGPTPAPAANSNVHYKVGDSVKIGNMFQMTVDSAKTDPGDEFNKPLKAGNIYILVAVTLKNTSSQEQNVSSLLQFHLHDAAGNQYTERINTNVTAPDGKLEPGDSLKGTLTYEIPPSTHQYVFAFEPDIVESGQTQWNLTV